jgi:hypothetical protein
MKRTVPGTGAGSLVRLVVVGGSVAVVAVAVVLFAAGYLAQPDEIPIGLDWIGYRQGWERLLATGTPYAPFELAGPFTPEHLDFIHPPSLLPFVAPFTALPTPFDYLAWLGFALALTFALLRRLAWWAYPIVAVLAITPNTLITYINGNSSMYLAAAFGWSLYVGWPAGLLALKPSLGPLAIPGFLRAPRRSLLLAVVPLGLTLPFLGAWGDFLTVLRNAQGLSPTYSLVQWTVFLIVAMPWLGERAPRWLERLRARAQTTR